MLFNSAEFLFAFLPLTAAGYWALGQAKSGAPRKVWLVIASLLFYGWWSPSNVALILGSIVLNYSIGRSICRTRAGSKSPARLLLIAGVCMNLAGLGYFKYFDLLRESLNALAGTHLDVLHLVLPLGISFFTFEQISYLVDAYRAPGTAPSFLDYA